ncbi:MAG: hypothetical protein F6K10_12365 [Moorea sp. SIO2B7]|nr:hypothetical protein [Moorena sp. SIO2B7]
MSLKTQEIIKQLKTLTSIEIAELFKELREAFSVNASP